MKASAFSRKLRANAPADRKAISHQARPERAAEGGMSRDEIVEQGCGWGCMLVLIFLVSCLFLTPLGALGVCAFLTLLLPPFWASIHIASKVCKVPARELVRWEKPNDTPRIKEARERAVGIGTLLILLWFFGLYHLLMWMVSLLPSNR